MGSIRQNVPDQMCTGCRLPSSQWTANDGEGIRGQDGQAFCCAECASGAGCVCRKDKRQRSAEVAAD